MKRRKLLIAGGGLIVLGAAIQLVPVERTNPPVEADLEAPPAVEAVLRTACYDCHSHETRWPWYGHVAPVSWLLASDVGEARHHLDFSRWGTLTTDRQNWLREDIWNQVNNGDMPPFLYRLGHREARLSQQQQATLHSWAEAVPGGDWNRQGARLHPSSAQP